MTLERAREVAASSRSSPFTMDSVGKSSPDVEQALSAARKTLQVGASAYSPFALRPRDGGIGGIKRPFDGMQYGGQVVDSLPDTVDVIARIRLPQSWGDLTTPPPTDSYEMVGDIFPNDATALDIFNSSFDENADAVIERLLGHTHSWGTLKMYFYAFRLWAQGCARGGWTPVPANEEVFSRYLVSLFKERGNVSCINMAICAVNYVHSLNGHEPFPSKSLPHHIQAALKRKFSSPVQQMNALEPWMLTHIFRHIPYRTEMSERNLFHWNVFLGIYIGMSLVGRYDCLTKVRLEPDFCKFHDSYVRLFLCKRKTDQFLEGQWIEVAATHKDICPLKLLKRWAAFHNFSGFLLRDLKHSSMGGYVAGRLDRPWSYGPFKHALREALVKSCGFTPEQARGYATHSMRIGGATEATRAGVPLHILKRHAGVNGHSWIDRYDRPSLGSRLTVSQSLQIPDPLSYQTVLFEDEPDEPPLP